MSRAGNLCRDLNRIMETSVVKLKKEVKGLTFIERKKVKIPKGTYTNLGPDSEDEDSIVLSDDENQKLYVIDKSLLKGGDK